MAKRLAELGALQDAVSNDESSPKRLALAGYIRGLFLDWSANPYNPLSRLTARGRLLGYFWDSGAIGLSMNFADQNYLVKDGTVQSKSFSQIVNFSRTTNATVTNSAGQITYAPHNLLTFSEQFDNAAWGPVRASIQSNQAISPNGTNTAEKFIEDTSTNTHILNRVLANPLGANTYTLSNYFKMDGKRYVQMTLIVDTASTNVRYATMFDLQEGIITDTSSLNSPTATANSIENVGNGWYRCSITIGNPSGLRVDSVYSLSNTATASATGIAYTGDGVSGVYLWGAQLEIGSTATTYNSTTVKNLLGYSELFDNAAWTKSNSFVQTNLLTYSEDYSQAAWTKFNATIIANSVIAPNGYQTADTLATTALGQTSIRQNLIVTSSVTYTFSCYLKAGTVNWARFELGASFISVYFDILNGTVGTTGAGITASITSVGNGWFRCVAVYTVPTTSGLFQISSATANGNVTANTNDYIYIWGAQLVQGSVAGDYRRTDAAALPVYYPNHNGVVCAEKLVENTATSVHQLAQAYSSSSGSYTFSAYLKAAERTTAYLQLSDGATGSVYAIANLSTGTVSKTATGSWTNTDISLVPVGNGWYRIAALGKQGAGTTIFPTIALGSNTSGYTGDGTSGVYIFGAQLSDSASLDPYVLNAAAAPTAAAYYGARFDYDPVTLAPKGLLIEEQRSNLLLQSSNFSTTWTTLNSTVTGTSGTSPDGTNNAFYITDDTTSGLHYVGQTYTTTAAAHTFSAYAKKGTTNYVGLYVDGKGVFFNLNTGAFSSNIVAAPTSYEIAPVGNGWYRLSIVVTLAAALQSFRIMLSQDGSSYSYVGSGKNALIYGSQVEIGTFATSYIPTASSQVTRAADVASIQGSNFYSWYNQNEGSVYSQAQSVMSTGALTYTQFNDGTVNNIIRQYASTTVYGIQVEYNSTTSAQITTGLGSNNLNKIAGAYKVNDFSAAQNNVLGTADTSGGIPIINRLSIGSTATPNLFLNGWIKSISYYPQRLSDSVLKGLTA